ncbi:MAG: pyridoxal-dependent decarboxylase, partial [Cyanobacteria bacterium J06635_10]
MTKIAEQIKGTPINLLAGSELVDSFTWDAHKLMGVPLICSAILVKNQ